MSGTPRPQPARMSPILTREVVAQKLAMPLGVLLRYEARGLVRPLRQGDIEGYGPAEVRRLWTVLTLHRDLGVNLAGVEAILRLRLHIDELHARLAHLADDLRSALEADRDPDPDGP